MSETNTLQYAKRFYFIEYYALLLESVEKCSNTKSAQKEFKDLKNKYYLGLSRYRKISINTDDNNNYETKEDSKPDKFEYTFSQVLLECRTFNLVSENKERKELTLTDDGAKLIQYFRKDKNEYKKLLICLMENKYQSFRYLLNKIYSRSPNKSGLIVFPNYSPANLGFSKDDFISNEIVYDYLNNYEIKIREDVKKYINQTFGTSNKKDALIKILIDKNFITLDKKDKFNIKKYNAVVRKTQIFWRNQLLEYYGIVSKWQSFEVWVYRAKQLGILNTTPFYPSFYGQIIYPTSIVTGKNLENSKDYRFIYSYPDGKKLYLRHLKWNEIENTFFTELWGVYSKLKKRTRVNFLSLHNIKEIVCYNLKISYDQFAEFLNIAYEQSLKGNTSYNISLEADNLPEETNAIYIKREPILVKGRHRNIIAISYKEKMND